MKNILIYPYNTEIGSEAYKCLSGSPNFKVFTAGNTHDCDLFFKTSAYWGMPFLKELDKVVKEKKIDLIVPCHDEVISVLHTAKYKNYLGYKNPSFRDKEIYYKHEDVLLLPKRYYSKEGINLTEQKLFAKPKVGEASKGIMEITKTHQLDYAFASNMIVMDHIEGVEYTVDCFAQDGVLTYIQPRTRNKISGGISTRGSLTNKCLSFPEIRKTAEAITQVFNLDGVFFFQCIVSRMGLGDCYLLEVGNRISGTSGANRMIGQNLLQAAIFRHFGHEISFIEQSIDMNFVRKLKFDEPSYLKDVKTIYVDFDDTILLNGYKLNEELLSWLFKMKLRGCRIHLISKKENFIKYLSYWWIKMFDICLCVEDKSDYIAKRMAKVGKRNKYLSLFIDDSFAERQKAAQPKLICVGPEMILG